MRASVVASDDAGRMDATVPPYLLEEAHSFVCCQKKQESENHHRHQHQSHVGENSSRPLRAPQFPVPQVNALGHTDLVLMLQVPGKLMGTATGWPVRKSLARKMEAMPLRAATPSIR